MPGLNEVDSIDSEDCNVMEAELSILLQSEDDEDAYSGSTTTNITAKLMEAATRNLHYSQSRKAIQSTTPVAVHEARLEKDFPHVRDNRNNTEEDNDEDSAVCVIHNERDRGVVDYNNCIETLSQHEQVELRRSIASNEKKKFVESAKRLSIQLGAYHTIIDENEEYRREIHQIQQDKDELEKSIVDMKLQLAQYQEKDDYQRLRIARLELDLKKIRAENHQLQEQVGIPDNKGRNRRLSKSLSRLESPSKQVYDSEQSGQQQQQRPIRHKSWLFGKDGLSNSILSIGQKAPFLTVRRDAPNHTRQDHQAVENYRDEQVNTSYRSEKEEGDLVRYNPLTIQSNGIVAVEDALLDSCNDLSTRSDGEGDSVTSTGSKSTALEFQPAKPQLQKKLSLRGVDVNLTMQDRIRKTETNPIQNAASLRGRGNKGNTSARFLAFC
jgi:hypothetical protein